MKSLTLRQPHASLVAAGKKTIETRSWRTSYRGPLIVHSGQRWAPGWAGWLDQDDWRINILDDIGADLNEDANGSGYYRADCFSLPLGAIVATAQLVDCVPMVGPLDVDDPIPHAVVVDNFGAGTLALFHEGDPFAIGCDEQLPFGDFRPGRWAWLLDDIKPTSERCPWCMGDRGDPEDEGWRHFGALEPGSRAACSVCDGAGRCDPIPAKGRQGLWNWDPTSKAVPS